MMRLFGLVKVPLFVARFVPFYTAINPFARSFKINMDFRNIFSKDVKINALFPVKYLGFRCLAFLNIYPPIE
jgi:hypothetical protein